ncbi:MAG: threonylcarbamoyl-AMP synthase [Desulfurococcales archaeon]|nr:threonylcarbamoyl-AMP synthase [Desulfurococcales archaeon]
MGVALPRILEADCYCPDRRVVEEAVRTIRAGGIVVAPTDTLYGLLADPFNPRAVERVYRVKKRSRDKPLPILLGESHHAILLVRPSSIFWRLALRFWPGPVTIVEEARPGLPSHLERWGPMGVRLPDCPLTREIIRRSGGALIGTSANISGGKGPVTVYDANEQLGDLVDLYIDAGPTRLGRPSTVVSVVGGSVEVLREGAVRREQIVGALADEDG